MDETPINVGDIPTPPTPAPTTPGLKIFKVKSFKPIEKCKKRLRAFSIQKKTPVSVTQALAPKTSTGSNTVVIGKLSSVKITPKPDDEQKKLIPKPPKPGTSKKSLQETPNELRKKTLVEIEDMKRKMELVDLGIPLGLICPTPDSDKAMPTKAMPPIKTFLEPAKVDELIREAKKAKAEGKQFKFDYSALLPDYDNPFQRKKEDFLAHDTEKVTDKESLRIRSKDRKSERHDTRRYSSHRKDDYRSRHKEDKRRSRDHKDHKEKEKSRENDMEREAEVNLSDYLVCDSWSLDNDEKSSSSPCVIEENTVRENSGESMHDPKTSSTSTSRKTDNHKKQEGKVPNADITIITPMSRLEKLRPVNDSFEFAIDPNEETLDIFQDKKTCKPLGISISDYSSNCAQDASFQDVNDESFLESVIAEIKQEELSDVSPDKGLVEYEDSPKDDDVSLRESQGSVTPELNDSIKGRSSQHSNYSDGYRSTESGYKSTESGYKSNESSYKLTESGYTSSGSDRNCTGRHSSNSYQPGLEKESDRYQNMSKTMVSLETWGFVLKICQPLLFRHDKNKCYRETHTFPKLWYTETPKLCNCVKDRSIVYEELEMCKPDIVDQLYQEFKDCQVPLNNQPWYLPVNTFLAESNVVQISSEWEVEEMPAERKESRGTLTPRKHEEMMLDREYQRFMDAVWPEMSDNKKETSGSTTPVQESRKKKLKDTDKETDDKKTKKMKLSTDVWSQGSEQDDSTKSAKKSKAEKVKKAKKRRYSTSTLSTNSEEEVEAKRKKKADKKERKLKSKAAKVKRTEKRKLKKLKEKQKKKKKLIKIEKFDTTSGDDDLNDKETKKKEHKKNKKKKEQKLKKRVLKKKAKKVSSSSDTSSSSSETSSDSESEIEKKSKKSKKKKTEARKKRKEERQKRKQSLDSNEELFDVNILNNIKTERLTDDEKSQKKLTDQDFSPRRQQKKNHEIINVKELQDDFVGNNIHIKIEKDDPVPENFLNKTENEEIGSPLNIEERNNDSEIIPEDSTDKIIVKPESSDSNLDIESENNAESEGAVIKIEDIVDTEKQNEIITESFKTEESNDTQTKTEDVDFKEPQDASVSQVKSMMDESNLSQCSSQESTVSIKDTPVYEKDDSHLRPSSQNSNYSFNDVINASQNIVYPKEKESNVGVEKYIEGYEAHNYEIYEQMAMEYQNDVAIQHGYPPLISPLVEEHRIETVVGSRNRGEIKCDWRPGDAPASQQPQRPSRWGLKPGEVNIVLTGGSSEQFPIHSVAAPVYRIESIANRNDAAGTGYDEAYMDMYGASDRLQYGDCFSTNNDSASNLDPSFFTGKMDPFPADGTAKASNLDKFKITQSRKDTKSLNSKNVANTVDPNNFTFKQDYVDAKYEESKRHSLEARIDEALKNTVLGEVAQESEINEIGVDLPGKGILITSLDSNRSSKRVTFADGYTPGQDSDVEEPPAKKPKEKKKKIRRQGCAWPCDASHPDHVPLWDALPPPPPPPGSPPPPARLAPPAHLLRRPQSPPLLPTPPHPIVPKFENDPSLPNMLTPDPPPSLGFELTN